jgi:hypothetical protein
VSEQRFRVWGGIAGALSIAALQGITRLGQSHSTLALGVYSVFGGAFAGASLAPAMLRSARRAGTRGASDVASSRAG